MSVCVSREVNGHDLIYFLSLSIKHVGSQVLNSMSVHGEK